MILLNATDASWGLYQLIFVAGVFLSLYSAYSWYEASREKKPEAIKKSKLLFLLAIVIMVTSSVVSFLITKKLPF